MHRSLIGGFVIVALLLTGCTQPASSEGGDRVASPLDDCAGLESARPSGEEPAGTGSPLPNLSLPCFTGGEPVAVAELRGPLVVNLWASWCAPCREELPALQRYADRAAGEVRVLGVVTGDRRAAAASLAEELGIRFPALEDNGERLRSELGAIGLPATAFVDSSGLVRYLHQQPGLDESTLAELVEEHLGAG